MTSEERVEAAAAVNARFAASREGFRESKDLTDEAKRRGVAQAWASATDAVRALKEEYLGEADRQRKALEEKLVRPAKLPFGATASEAIARDASFRDALDRAEKAEDAEALTGLLRRAEKFGDPIQVRAVVAVALERGDVNTINAHVEAHPEEEADIQALFDVSGERKLSDRLRVEMVMPDPPIPGELGHQVSEYKIREIAAGAADPVAVSS